MKQPGLIEIIDQILAKDTRYDREAYAFVRDALEFTLRKLRKNNTPGETGASRHTHVSADELLEGLRQHALAEFGPMVPTVFSFWGIHSSADIGQIVFNLIESGLFGRSEQDRIEDFTGALDFHKAFVEPFEPGTVTSNDSPRIMKPVPRP